MQPLIEFPRISTKYQPLIVKCTLNCSHKVQTRGPWPFRLASDRAMKSWQFVGRIRYVEGTGRAFFFGGMLLRQSFPLSLSPSPIDENAIKCYFFFFSFPPRSPRPFLALLCRDCSRGLMGVLAPNRMGGIKEGRRGRQGCQKAIARFFD